MLVLVSTVSVFKFAPMGVHPGRAGRRCRALAVAGDGADDSHGRGCLPGGLPSPSRGGTAAGWPPGRRTRPRRGSTNASPVITRTGPRSLCPAPARRHRGTARAPRDRAAKPPTSRPSPWPTNSACARSRPTATAASAPCMPRSAEQEQARAELSAAIELYRAMEMTFWLPQAEAALAQVEGR